MTHQRGRQYAKAKLKTKTVEPNPVNQMPQLMDRLNRIEVKLDMLLARGQQPPRDAPR